MEARNFHYGTVSEAINNFKKKGYTVDFNLDENCFVCFGNNKYNLDEFEIVEIYRYEGDSDPGDEATVYAIESKSGVKGILLTGYGISISPRNEKMLKELKYRK